MKTKQIKMDPKLAGAMKNQLRAFKKKFGRVPRRWSAASNLQMREEICKWSGRFSNAPADFQTFFHAKK